MRNSDYYFFFKSHSPILLFYHCILVLFGPWAVAEFWSQMLSLGVPGGMRGCVADPSRLLGLW